MDILFISTSIPPFTDMQSIRNAFLLQSLKKKGHNVTILTAEFPWGDNSLIDLLPRDQRVLKTRTPIFVKLQKILMKKNFLKPLLKVFNISSNIFLIPDIQMFWDIQAIKLIKKLYKKKNNFDLVITSSGSYTAHIVGRWLKKNHNIPWVAEYGDPWGVDEYGEVKSINHALEQKLLRYVDGITFTTPTTIDVYNKVSNFPMEKMRLIPCGYEFIIADPVKEKAEQKKKISYTGVAYASSRNLSNAIKAISNVSSNNFQLDMVGTFSEKYKNEAKLLSNLDINFKGRVSYRESLNHIASSDILLHIGNKGIMQVPGKTYIYLSSKKPILYIQQSNIDPTLALLKKFGGVVFCENDELSIVAALKDLISNYEFYKTEANNREFNDEFHKYHWDYIGNEFVEFVEKVKLG